MTPGRPDARVFDRHLGALRRTLTALRRHQGVSSGSLGADLDLIARILSDRLDDFEEFARHVERWLAMHPDP